MDLVVYDDDEKRYVPWAVALAGVLLVALVTGVLTFLLARQASGAQGEQVVSGVSSPAPASAPSEQPLSGAPADGATTAACVAALQRADVALERSVALDEALTEHTRIMDELLAERIDADEALDRTLPVLTDGATERRRFEQELSAYTEVRETCGG